MNKRNHYSANFKAQVLIEVLRKETTVNEITAKHCIHPVRLSRWKQEFIECVSDVFKKGHSEAEKKLKKERSVKSGS